MPAISSVGRTVPAISSISSFSDKLLKSKPLLPAEKGEWKEQTKLSGFAILKAMEGGLKLVEIPSTLVPFDPCLEAGTAEETPRKESRTTQLVHRRRQAVRLVHFGHAAKFPQRVLQPLGQALETL